MVEVVIKSFLNSNCNVVLSCNVHPKYKGQRTVVNFDFTAKLLLNRLHSIKNDNTNQ